MNKIYRYIFFISILFQLSLYKPILNFKLVIDPVMISKSGAHLLESSAVNDFIKKLIPLADVLTPNLPEASVLLNRQILTQNHMLSAAKDLVTLGAKAVVVKGGHLENSEQSNDVLFYNLEDKDCEHWFNSSRIKTNNTHGTGCNFSAAVCAFLAKNYTVYDAVLNAKKFVTSSLEEGVDMRLGEGHGPAKF